VRWPLLLCVIAGCGRLGFEANGDGGAGPQPVDAVNAFGCGLRDLAVGGSTSCAIDGSGGLWCWGSLGEGSGPGRVPLDEPAVKVRLGHSFGCVLLASGKLRCFGQNGYGNLGDGTMQSSGEPVVPVGDRSYVDVATLGYSTCAVSTGGDLECWGENQAGLNEGAFLVPTVVPVAGASGFRRVFSSKVGACAETDTKRYCWGTIPFIDAPGRDAPTEVAVTQPVAMSQSSGCILDNGNVRCAGTTNGGELGDGRIDVSSFSTTGTLVSGVAAIAAGPRITCAIGTDGALSCWGQNRSGEIGTGDISVQPTPVRISIPPTARVALAFAHTCAETSDGVYCWGSNSAGALGRGTRDSDIAGSPIAGLQLAGSIAEVRIGSRQAFGCARTTTGDVWCWGQGISGVTGDATRRSSPMATKISLPFAANGIGVGEGFACAHDTAEVRCWGSTQYQAFGPTLGSGFYPTPVAIPGITGTITSMTVGGSHGMCVVSSGQAYCWGQQQQTGTYDPTTITGLPSASVITPFPYSLIEEHQCALDTAGNAYCWGRNIDGELGRDTGGAPSFTPALVTGGRAYSQIATITHYAARTCAIPVAGVTEIDCWGWYNGSSSIVPTTYMMAAAPVRLEGSGSNLCAILADGTRECVGDNARGQFGDGTGSSSNTFLHVTNVASAITLSGDNACFVEAGVVRCVGATRHGALGATPPSATPQRVDLMCK